MDEKKYEAGRVEISSAEYRDLVTEVTENRIGAMNAKSDKWRAEAERDMLKDELKKAKAEIEVLKNKLRTCSSLSWSPLRDSITTDQGGKNNG